MNNAFANIDFQYKYPFTTNEEVTIQIIHPETKEVIQTFYPFHYEIELDLNNFKREVERWIKEITPIYNKEMTLDRIDMDGEIIKGTPKVEIDQSLLLEQLLQLSFTGGMIELPLKKRESGYRKEDAPQLNEVILASYTTYFNKNKVGRSKNIELSATAIHNVIVGSGDIFSFNSVVGPREIAYGYQMAPEFVRGKVVMGIGGGICLTSSTLFNAVDQLDVEIIERHHHSMDVGYVPKGRDATVSFGGLDFRFQNTTGIPFLIKAYYHKSGAITIEIRTSKEYADLYRNELLITQ
ncbi:MAG: VanW family protein [Lysinibacillus sp.]|nr:VanW family protein [Lysinibacillus sp.]